MIIKKIKRFRKKFKRLYFTMLKNYILFNVFTTVIMFVSAIIISILMGDFRININNKKVSNENNWTHYRAIRVVKSDYRKIDTKDVFKSGGWVEILNQNYKIIYVKGRKLDKIKKYSLSFIINNIDNNYMASLKKKGYVYSVVSFKPYNDLRKTYYCVVKYPANNVDVSLYFFKTKGVRQTSLTRRQKVVQEILSPVIIICLFVISILVYSLFTSKKMIKPLKKILEGIEKFKKDDYSARIEFDAENEFAMIKDSFNEMAQKIQNSKKEREEQERQKQQLLVDISHDLKTPITSIQGYSKALWDDIVQNKEKEKRYLEIIYKKSERTVYLIDRLHELTKLQNEMYTLDVKRGDFVEFVREVIASEYGEIVDNGFNLEMEIPEYEIFYDFDRKEMSRVILNIIGNAIKYNPKGVTIKVCIENSNKGITLAIQNDGIEIPQDLKETIFEPFTRGDKARKTTGGTGLGLSISKMIVEKHGGSIEICSEEGFKTVFKIILPFINRSK